MANDHLLDETKNRTNNKKAAKETVLKPIDKVDLPVIAGLQQQVGNRAVQRLLTQRSAGDAYELDEAIETRINRERNHSLPLDPTVQTQMTQAFGHDFSDVRIHTSSESDSLNRQLGAKAFTTGQDIFFREGAYTPNASSGQELIAHELTHVVQQSTGIVHGDGNRMVVNAPGDAFEQQADEVAQKATSSATTPASVQRQEEQEDEEDNPSLQLSLDHRQSPLEEEEQIT